MGIAAHPELELQVLAAGTMVLERFHQPVEVVRKDGFNVDGQIFIELEGSTPVTMAKSVGFEWLSSPVSSSARSPMSSF